MTQWHSDLISHEDIFLTSIKYIFIHSKLIGIYTEIGEMKEQKRINLNSV